MRVDTIDEVDVVHVSGEIDLSNVHALSDGVAATTAAGVVLDLGELTYIDSAGIRAIDLGYRSLAADERSLLVVVVPGTPAEWIFRVSGLADRVTAASLPEALASLRDRAVS